MVGVFLNKMAAKMAVLIRRPYSSLSGSLLLCSLRFRKSFMRCLSSFPPGPELKDFIRENEINSIKGASSTSEDSPPYLSEGQLAGRNRKGKILPQNYKCMYYYV